MKHVIQIGFVGIVWMCLLTAPPVFAETVIATAFRYDAFTDDSSSETQGFEVTMPLGIAYKAENFSLSLETAYSSAHIDAVDEDAEARLSNVTDTLVSATYSYLISHRPLALMIGVDVNLPSGKATLDEHEKRAEAGESNDLFEVDEFGAGLNVSPSVGLLWEFEAAALAMQGSYIFNGEYDPDSDVPDNELDPGDQAFFTGAFDWKTASWLELGGFVSHSHFTPDTTNGEENFREGQRVVVEGHGRVKRAPLSLLVSLQYALQDKNEVLVDERLQQESQNSNGKEFFGLAAVTYTVSRALSLRAQADVRYYGESPFHDEITGLPYSGKRIRYAVGPGFYYLIRNNLACNGLFKLFTMNQDASMFDEEEVAFWGTNLDVGVTYMF